MRAILDIQHKGKPGKNDLGAAHDIDGDGVVEQWEHEANLTPIYAEHARAALVAAGVDVVILDRGAYSTRHKKAAELAEEWTGPVAYVACHLNMGGGDYGLVVHDYRSTGGNLLASRLRSSLLKRLRPELRRVINGQTGPAERPSNEAHALAWDRMPRYAGEQHWPRAWYTIQGIYKGPANLSGVCFEPCFMDSQAELCDPEGEGLQRIGDALARGVLDWLKRRSQ